MKCSIQRGEFYLSPHENICTIALTNIHYLYNKPYIHLSLEVRTGNQNHSENVEK